MFKKSGPHFVFPNSFPLQVFCCWLQSSIFLFLYICPFLSKVCIQFLCGAGGVLVCTITVQSKQFSEGNLNLRGCHWAWIWFWKVCWQSAIWHWSHQKSHRSVTCAKSWWEEGKCKWVKRREQRNKFIRLYPHRQTCCHMMEDRVLYIHLQVWGGEGIILCTFLCA